MNNNINNSIYNNIKKKKKQNMVDVVNFESGDSVNFVSFSVLDWTWTLVGV